MQSKPKLLQKFEKLKQRHKPLYKKAFEVMNATTTVLQSQNID
jgi:hypothetical protein